jgi:NADP-reducing hydrogenase subunit HndB
LFRNKKMAKIKSLTELTKIREDMQHKMQVMQDASDPESMVQVKVGMATSGIASGAKEVYHFFKESLVKRNIEAEVTAVGDMGYCYAEPTVEVTLPGKEPVVFGPVNIAKADEIIEQFVKAEQVVDGVIPVNYKTINEI